MNEKKYTQFDFTSSNSDFTEDNNERFQNTNGKSRQSVEKDSNSISRYYCQICQKEWTEEAEFFVNPKTNNHGMRKKITYFEASATRVPVANSYINNLYFENSTVNSEDCDSSIKQRNCRKCTKKRSEDNLRNPLITLRDTGIMKPSMKRKLYLATATDSEQEESEDKVKRYKMQCKTITEHWTSPLCVSKYCINKAWRYGYCRKCYKKVNK